MNVTKTELEKLLGRRPTVRRHPTLGRADRRALSEPSMAPTGGLTPAITSPGLKTYLYACRRGVAIAQWTGNVVRQPVTWLSWEEWANAARAHDLARISGASEGQNAHGPPISSVDGDDSRGG